MSRDTFYGSWASYAQEIPNDIKERLNQIKQYLDENVEEAENYKKEKLVASRFYNTIKKTYGNLSNEKIVAGWYQNYITDAPAKFREFKIFKEYAYNNIKDLKERGYLKPKEEENYIKIIDSFEGVI